MPPNDSTPTAQSLTEDSGALRATASPTTLGDLRDVMDRIRGAGVNRQRDATAAVVAVSTPRTQDNVFQRMLAYGEPASVLVPDPTREGQYLRITGSTVRTGDVIGVDSGDGESRQVVGNVAPSLDEEIARTHEFWREARRQLERQAGIPERFFRPSASQAEQFRTEMLNEPQTIYGQSPLAQAVPPDAVRGINSTAAVRLQDALDRGILEELERAYNASRNNAMAMNSITIPENLRTPPFFCPRCNREITSMRGPYPAPSQQRSSAINAHRAVNGNPHELVDPTQFELSCGCRVETAWAGALSRELKDRASGRGVDIPEFTSLDKLDAAIAALESKITELMRIRDDVRRGGLTNRAADINRQLETATQKLMVMHGLRKTQVAEAMDELSDGGFDALNEATCRELRRMHADGRIFLHSMLERLHGCDGIELFAGFDETPPVFHLDRIGDAELMSLRRDLEAASGDEAIRIRVRVYEKNWNDLLKEIFDYVAETSSCTYVTGVPSQLVRRFLRDAGTQTTGPLPDPIRMALTYLLTHRLLTKYRQTLERRKKLETHLDKVAPPKRKRRITRL